MKRMQLVVLVGTVAFAPLLLAEPADAPKAGECKRLPSDKRILKLEFRPETAMLDLLSTYSQLSCKKLNVTGDLSPHRVTMTLPKPLSLQEFSAALRAEATKLGIGYTESNSTLDVKAPGRRAVE